MVDGPYSHHDDLRGLFDRLGSERASFVGCSMGGGALIDFAPRHPRHACALVLVGPAGSGVEPDEAPSEEWDELVAADEAGDRPPRSSSATWTTGRRSKRVPTCWSVASRTRQRSLCPELPTGPTWSGPEGSTR
jgi:pimeloyl-ACP methyl ester carboxylesterase